MDYTYRFMRFKDGKAKAFTLSYDDGVDQDIRFMKILDKNGLKCTFNISAGRFAPEGTTYDEGRVGGRLMTKSQAINLYKNSGHEVAIHGYTHPNFANLPTNQSMYEIIEDRRALEEIFGTLVRGCAYPFGSFNDDIVKMMELAQIKYARTTLTTNDFKLPTDWLRLKATCHHNNPELMNLAEKFAEKTPQGAELFYVWGHTYEFDRYKNWDMFEKFAEYIGGRTDIWYATNIEIYDYIEAYNNLQVSADGKTVYNPTVTDVWMYAEGEVYKVPSGETIKIK